MNTGSALQIFIWLQLVLSVLSQETRCPSKCLCKVNSQRDGGNYLKMTCGEREKVTHLDELELLNTASELVQLNLSNNLLKAFEPKVELIVLQKLNLSGNQITHLEKNQFKLVPKLKRLDLSENSIKQIDLGAFNGLQELERLKLNHNELASITVGTLDDVPNLKQLDISNNPLQCDCGLLWILDYAQIHALKLMSNPKCSSTFKGLPLRKLKVGIDIHCRSASNDNILPLLDLKPENNQVVFEGDSLKLHCRAPSITDTINDSRLEWLWLDSKPKDHFSDITIVDEFLPNPGIIDSILIIKKLKKYHTGIWSCLFTSIQGNHSKSTTIFVLSEDTRFCPITTTKDNKGSYIWPKTVANNTVTLACEFINDYYESSTQTTSYSCSTNGTWVNLNTEKCSYTSDTTRILEGFSKVNSSILESAKHLKEFTSNLTLFKDPMDLRFAIEAMESYAQTQPGEPLSNVLMDVASNLMHLPSHYLRFEGLRLLAGMESWALGHSGSLFQRENFVIESFPTGKESFSGIKCSWFRNEHNPLDSLFSCSLSHNVPDATVLQGKTVETSVIVPDSLFAKSKNEVSEEVKDYSVLVSMHTTSKLFPIDREREGQEAVTSAVVGVKIVGPAHAEPSHPITVTIRAPHSSSAYEVTPFTPVYWDASLARWTTQGCRFGQHWQDHVVFSCRKLGYYGLMQDVSNSNVSGSYGGQFRASHPAIYVGNVILFFALLTAILTYIFGFASIQTPKKAKHCLINTWISIAALCFMYTFGIYQSEEVKLCQIVGLTLHYLSLCAMLWMCVTVNSMYKRLSKNGESILQDDDLPSEPPVKKPIMGLYLVGWGVALIVCGLSAAINIREYASPSRCFLRTGPALSAIYVPFTILFLFMLVFFLLIRCAISNLDLSHGGHLSEGTQATEHVDLDLLEPNFPHHQQQQQGSVRSCSSKTAASSEETEDHERSPLAQLKAHVIFVFLFLITWLSCAFATVPPLGWGAYEADLFSGAYAISATTLGTFTLFFYCVARNDVRTQWMGTFRWIHRKRLVRPRTVSDTQPRIVQPPPLPPVSNSDAQALSRSSSRSSSRTKSNSFKGAAAALDLNSSISDRVSIVGGTKINNVNLIALHRAQYRTHVVPHIIENPTSAAEVFYNPHQSTVARKFFRRQKRDLHKRNNLMVHQTKPPRDVNSDATSLFSEPPQQQRPPKNKNAEQNMFGTNSKVNNTNIHVEQIRKSQRKNPNIFSDSGEEFDMDVPMDKIVINAERLRKKDACRGKTRPKKSNLPLENHAQTQMRTVSQQCTLDYSSENPLSDSILDKSDILTPIQAISLKQIEKLVAEEGSSGTPIMETSGTTETTAHSSTRRENSPVEEQHHYAEIEELRDSESTIRGGRFGIGGINSPLARLRSPSNFSRASSATDIDELYQQIRRGPLVAPPSGIAGHHFSAPQKAYSSPLLSDSEITGFTNENRPLAFYDEDFSSVDVETTV